MQGRLGPAIAAEGGMESIKMAGRLTFERKTSKADMRGLNGPKELRLDLVDSSRWLLIIFIMKILSFIQGNAKRARTRAHLRHVPSSDPRPATHRKRSDELR